MFLKFNALLLLLVTSVVSPLTLAQPDSGLLISRSNSQDWQLRLVGGTEAQQFSGTLESSMPFRYVRAATTAGAEGAQLTAPASLNVNLTAGPGGSDQVNFAVSVDAKLCLRDTGGTDVKIYLGDSLSDAIPVTAPASLGGIDACTDTTGAVHRDDFLYYIAGNRYYIGGNQRPHDDSDCSGQEISSWPLHCPGQGSVDAGVHG